MELTRVVGEYAICRLPPDASAPSLTGFSSITRTAEELSVVCAEAQVPAGARAERGWCCLRVAGTLDFSQAGVLSALTAPLASAGVSVFAISTFYTDYLLVRSASFHKAVAALLAAGHRVR